MKKKLIFLSMGILLMLALGITWFILQKEEKYDVTIDSTDLSVTLCLEAIARHEPVDKIMESRCVVFDVKSRKELYEAIKDLDVFAYSLVNGEKSSEEADQY